MLVGGAIALYYLTREDEEGKEGQRNGGWDEIEQLESLLGVPRKDAEGFLEFGYFIQAFEIVHMKGKRDFEKKKKDWVKERRQALERGDEKHY